MDLIFRQSSKYIRSPAPQQNLAQGHQQANKLGYTKYTDTVTDNITSKIRIANILDMNDYDDTSCFNEPLKNMGVFTSLSMVPVK